jgi:hypothetical protein
MLRNTEALIDTHTRVVAAGWQNLYIVQVLLLLHTMMSLLHADGAGHFLCTDWAWCTIPSLLHFGVFACVVQLTS